MEIEEVKEIVGAVEKVLSTRIVGQKDCLKKMLLALFSGGHVLLEGVPGIAKTLMASSLAQVFSLDFKRIQFTPDLLPSDVVGMSIFRPDEGKFVAEKGPVFTNIVLADEINRSPPKVQAAMLEVMAEKQVTIFGQTFFVYPPYFVIATQNPIEQEGTYPLPEAELDRFMMKICVGYPSEEEEKNIVETCMVEKMPPPLKNIIQRETILEIQEKVDAVYVDDQVIRYAVSIVQATRPSCPLGEKRKELIVLGASPRAALWLVRGSKALAVYEGRDFVTPFDIKVVAHDILRHRLIMTYKAQADGFDTDMVIKSILKEIPSP